MGLFSFGKSSGIKGASDSSGGFANLALNAIADGVVVIDANNIIKYANPAAASMTGFGSPQNVVGLEYSSVLRLENSKGSPIPEEQNLLRQAIQTNQSMSTREYQLLTAESERRIPVALTFLPTGGPKSNKLITFRDITKELEEENAQTEFISTASHEMRTPVASIEGYLGLALNPSTATIDNRARQYLDAAHKASQHLGRLFKDLLDVTKLDDGRDRVQQVPVEITTVVREMAAAYAKKMAEKNLTYAFGVAGSVANEHKLNQPVYAVVDMDFLREILDNLIENAIKYTPAGGKIWVYARGDGDKALISVSDSGIGIAADDLPHIFQKFYRVDNSQTRQIGGTGLGLYLVKQRAETMGGRVWAESAYGSGSTFFVSLPRLSETEFRRRQLAYNNQQTIQNFSSMTPNTTRGQSAIVPENGIKVPAGVTPLPTPAAGAVGQPGASVAGGVNGAGVVGVAKQPAATPAPPVPPVLAAPKLPNPTVPVNTTTPKISNPTVPVAAAAQAPASQPQNTTINSTGASKVMSGPVATTPVATPPVATNAGSTVQSGPSTPAASGTVVQPALQPVQNGLKTSIPAPVLGPVVPQGQDNSANATPSAQINSAPQVAPATTTGNVTVTPPAISPQPTSGAATINNNVKGE